MAVTRRSWSALNLPQSEECNAFDARRIRTSFGPRRLARREIELDRLQDIEDRRREVADSWEPID